MLKPFRIPFYTMFSVFIAMLILAGCSRETSTPSQPFTPAVEPSRQRVSDSSKIVLNSDSRVYLFLPRIVKSTDLNYRVNIGQDFMHRTARVTILIRFGDDVKFWDENGEIESDGSQIIVYLGERGSTNIVFIEYHDANRKRVVDEEVLELPIEGKLSPFSLFEGQHEILRWRDINGAKFAEIHYNCAWELPHVLVEVE